MSFVDSISTVEPRTFSIGPMKVEFHTYAAASGDTGGTVTSKSIDTVLHVLVDGLEQTALPSASGKTITLAFTDPVATVYGTVIIFGR